MAKVQAAQVQVQKTQAHREVAEEMARVGEVEAAARIARWQPEAVEVAEAEAEELLASLGHLDWKLELLLLPALQGLPVQLMPQA